MNLFDLVAVEFGEEVTSARPVDFEYDQSGIPTRILKLVTTCPHCGSLNELDANGLDIIEGIVINLRCIQCKKGKDDFDKFLDTMGIQPVPSEVAKPSISVEIERPVGCNVSRPMIKPNVKSSVVIDDNGSFVCPSTFVDPVALGLFKVDEV